MEGRTRYIGRKQAVKAASRGAGGWKVYGWNATPVAADILTIAFSGVFGNRFVVQNGLVTARNTMAIMNTVGTSFATRKNFALLVLRSAAKSLRQREHMP